MHPRRQRRRVAAGTLSLIAIAAVTIFAWPSRSPLPKPAPIVPQVAHDDAVAPAPAQIVRVTTDASILDRYRSTAESSAERIDDDEELLGDLMAMGQPSGIVRMTGQSRIVEW